MNRVTFPAQLADLGFSIDIPEGFIPVEIPRQDVDFDNPTQSAPLAMYSSQVAMALIVVAARPAYATGSVLQWVRYLAGHFGMQLQHVQIRHVGAPPTHPGVTAFATQVQDGQTFHFMLVAFEDGGRLVTAHGMCPKELWASYGDALSTAVESIVLTAPKGPAHDVDTETAEGWGQLATPSQARAQYERLHEERRKARQPAVARAQPLLAQERYDEAEALILQVDPSIQGGVEIARMYERLLRSLVDAGRVGADRPLAERVFGRALRWAQACYPEAHTQEEANSFEAGRAPDRARLVKVLGYDPDLPSGSAPRQAACG